MPQRFYKFKLLLDEGLYSRKSLPRINSRYDIKHIKHDLKSAGIEDEQVYNIAVQEKRIIITYNTRDFRRLAKNSMNSGIIGVSQGVTREQLDAKLNALLSKSSKKSLYGKYTPLSKNK